MDTWNQILPSAQEDNVSADISPGSSDEEKGRAVKDSALFRDTEEMQKSCLKQEASGQWSCNSIIQRPAWSVILMFFLSEMFYVFITVHFVLWKKAGKRNILDKMISSLKVFFFCLMCCCWCIVNNKNLTESAFRYSVHCRGGWYGKQTNILIFLATIWFYIHCIFLIWKQLERRDFKNKMITIDCNQDPRFNFWKDRMIILFGWISL